MIDAERTRVRLPGAALSREFFVYRRELSEDRGSGHVRREPSLAGIHRTRALAADMCTRVRTRILRAMKDPSFFSVHMEGKRLFLSISLIASPLSELSSRGEFRDPRSRPSRDFRREARSLPQRGERR